MKAALIISNASSLPSFVTSVPTSSVPTHLSFVTTTDFLGLRHFCRDLGFALTALVSGFFNLGVGQTIGAMPTTSRRFPLGFFGETSFGASELSVSELIRTAFRL